MMIILALRELVKLSCEWEVRGFENHILSISIMTDNFRDLGASQTTVEAETKKLEELKSIIFHEFRREVLNRLKKQSEKVLFNIL